MLWEGLSIVSCLKEKIDCQISKFHLPYEFMQFLDYLLSLKD